MSLVIGVSFCRSRRQEKDGERCLAIIAVDLTRDGGWRLGFDPAFCSTKDFQLIGWVVFFMMLGSLVPFDDVFMAYKSSYIGHSKIGDWTSRSGPIWQLEKFDFPGDSWVKLTEKVLHSTMALVLSEGNLSNGSGWHDQERWFVVIRLYFVGTEMVLFGPFCYCPLKLNFQVVEMDVNIWECPSMTDHRSEGSTNIGHSTILVRLWCNKLLFDKNCYYVFSSIFHMCKYTKTIILQFQSLDSPPKKTKIQHFQNRYKNKDDIEAYYCFPSKIHTPMLKSHNPMILTRTLQ